MKIQNGLFSILALIMAMLACSLPDVGSDEVVATPTIEPTTVVYVVIEPTATIEVPTETPVPASPTPELPPEITLTKNSNCRKGPSEFYVIVDQIAKDKNNVPISLPVIGQNKDGTWWQVINATNQECWIFGENTQPNTDFSNLPIKEGPALPDTPSNFLVSNQICQPSAKKHEVSFSWIAGGNTDGFRIYRNGNRIIELKAERLNYKDINAPLEVNLSYELEAFNKNGTSPKAIQIVSACK